MNCRSGKVKSTIGLSWKELYVICEVKFTWILLDGRVEPLVE